MFTRVFTVLLALTLPAVAEAKKPRPPKPQPVVLATYPANDEGVTYQVEREGCGKDECAVVVRVLRDGKEQSHVATVSVPGGADEKLKPDEKATSPLARADTWAFARHHATKEQGKTLVTIVPVALDSHEKGLLLRTMEVLPEEGLPSSRYTLVGLANGTLQELFRAHQTELETDLDVEVRLVGSDAEVVLSERAQLTDQIGWYGIFVRDQETGLFTRQRALFGVALGVAEGMKALEQAARACKAFTGAASAKLLYGPAFSALGESGGVAVAITTDEKQAKQWVQEITSCHKGTAPSVVRLK